MAGLADLTKAAFKGSKPGPEPGQDFSTKSPLAMERVSEGIPLSEGIPRQGSNVIFDAFSQSLTPKQRRAANRLNRGM